MTYYRACPRQTPRNNTLSVIPDHVLDRWFKDVVKPRLRGAADEIRFADGHLVL